MSKSSSDIYDYIVRELGPTGHEPDEAPITISCEPLAVGNGVSPRSAIPMRLTTGTTAAATRAIAEHDLAVCSMGLKDQAARVFVLATGQCAAPGSL